MKATISISVNQSRAIPALSESTFLRYFNFIALYIAQGIPEGLALFKALCRYYYPINPAATSSYVHAYRDLWDSEKSEEQEGNDA